MKQEDLLKSLNYVDDELIERADQQHNKKKYFWKSRTLVAACMIILVGIGVGYILYRETNIDELEQGENHNIVEDTQEQNTLKLPMLTITSGGEAMGFEGYQAYDIEELENGNPWSEGMEIATMPVYENLIYSGGARAPIYNGDADDLLEIAQGIATELNMDIKNVVYQKDVSETGKVYAVEIETNLATISVEGNECIAIFYDEGFTLPKEYRLSISLTSSKEAEKTLNYLLQQFSNIMSFDQPKFALFSDYSLNGDMSTSYSVYDEKGTIENKLLNYNFNKVDFVPNEDGNLYIVRINNGLSNVKKLGDYPIITVEEAKELLLNDNYITNVSEKLPGEEYIKKVELIYRSSNLNETFIPYYRFLVELPGEEYEHENGLKTFGAYYVPAVEQQYIKNMPLWEGND